MTSRPASRLLAGALALIVSLCAVLMPQSAVAAEPPLRVLFVGNSLTYVLSLPLVVEAVAVANGGPRIVTRDVSKGGYSLGDHWLRRGVRTKIKRGDWDFVVLQQGPSALETSRVLLRRDVALFAGLIRGADAEPAVYQVWPERERIEVFPDVIESYRLAAADVGAPLLAVGSAWQAAWSLDPTLKLHGPDGLHPSPLAVYLAALVIYEGLTGRSAVGTPSALPLRNGRRITVTDAQAATLQLAAEMVRAPDPN